MNHLPHRPRPGNFRFCCMGHFLALLKAGQLFWKWTKFIPREILSHLPDLVKKMKEVSLYCKIIWGNF